MELVAERSERCRALQALTVFAVVALAAFGCGSSDGSTLGGSGSGVEVKPMKTANQSCTAFAPEDELGNAIGATVRFEPASGGNETDGWACWYYVNGASVNNLLVEVLADAPQGRRMVSEEQPRDDITNLGGKVYLTLARIVHD